MAPAPILGDDDRRVTSTVCVVHFSTSIGMCSRGTCESCTWFHFMICNGHKCNSVNAHENNIRCQKSITTVETKRMLFLYESEHCNLYLQPVQWWNSATPTGSKYFPWYPLSYKGRKWRQRPHWGGGRGVGQNVTIVLIGCVNGTVTRGEGVQKSENFADVI